MAIIERILGINPSKNQVINEFKSRKLSIDNNELVHEENGKFHVSGHFSTQSETKEIALMKFAILMDEVA